MPYSAENAAAQVQERLKALYQLVHKIETERQKGEHTLENIYKAHNEINKEGRLTSYNQHNLKSLYKAAKNDAHQEEELLRQALMKITEIRTICNERRLQARKSGHVETFHRGAIMKMVQVSAQTLPLWVGKPGTKAPPLCGAVPADSNYIAKPGDMVAALVKNVEGDEVNWILAKVVSYNAQTKKYEVDDIDEEQKSKHILCKRKVVPLPLMRANPETDSDALFQKGAVVMALYPQTTCFYKAVVNQPPSSPTEDYELLFEDLNYADGYAPPLHVSQGYVIDIKEKKKITTTTA